MKTDIMTDMLRLALSKKNFSKKILYVFQGLVFAPFIFNENRKYREGSQNVSEVSLAGDDVYPLF